MFGVRGRMALVVVLGLTALLAASGAAPGAQKLGTIKPIKVGKYKVQPGGTSGVIFRNRGLMPPGGLYVNVRRGPRANDYSDDGGTATSRRIKGKVGRFGKIDLRFHRSGPFEQRKLPHGCHGAPDKRQPGTWKGIFKFKGENGIGKVRRTELEGARLKLGDYSCNGGPRTFVSLSASIETGGYFSALKRRSGGKPQFFAQQLDHKRGADIQRSAFMRGKPSQFRYVKDLSSATAKPGGPFSGTGRYSANIKRARGFSDGTLGVLTGSLGVKFLAQPDKVALRSNDAILSEFTTTPIRAERLLRAAH